MNPPFTLAFPLRLFTRPWRSDSSRELCSCWADRAEITLNLAEVVRMQALGIRRRGSTFGKHLQSYACTFFRVLGSDSAARAKNKSHRPRSERLMQIVEIVKVLRFFCAGNLLEFLPIQSRDPAENLERSDMRNKEQTTVKTIPSTKSIKANLRKSRWSSVILNGCHYKTQYSLKAENIIHIPSECQTDNKRL